MCEMQGKNQQKARQNFESELRPTDQGGQGENPSLTTSRTVWHNPLTKYLLNCFQIPDELNAEPQQ